MRVKITIEKEDLDMIKLLLRNEASQKCLSAKTYEEVDSVGKMLETLQSLLTYEQLK